MTPARALRAGLALLLLILGVFIGGAATVVHATTVGLPLAIAATAATSYALPGGWGTRFPFGLGWLVVPGYTAQQRPEGDYLVAADAHGYALLGFGLALLMFSIISTRPLRPAPDNVSDDEPSTDAPPAPAGEQT